MGAFRIRVRYSAIGSVSAILSVLIAIIILEKDLITDSKNNF
jgi:hypothetical protein